MLNGGEEAPPINCADIRHLTQKKGPTFYSKANSVQKVSFKGGGGFKLRKKVKLCDV